MIEYKFQEMLPYHAHDLYELVMDFASYPKIFSFIHAARVRELPGQQKCVDLSVGTSLLNFRQRNKVTYDPGRRIDIHSENGPFKQAVGQWHFEPQTGGGTKVFHISKFDFGRGLSARMAKSIIPDQIEKTRVQLKKYIENTLQPVEQGHPISKAPQNTFFKNSLS